MTRILLPLLLVAALPSALSAWPGTGTPPAAPPDCLDAYGVRACGYHCTAGYGQVGCSRSPMGACAAAYGRLVCWDPPDVVVDGYGGAGPSAGCTAEYGLLACGHDCVAGFGQVRCAATPAGRCRAAYGMVACWDPADDVLARHGTWTPPGQCLAEYGTIACGWSCVAAYGQVRCARRPDARCFADRGSIVCSDD